MRYLNIHTHFPTGHLAVLEVENLYFGQAPSGKSPFLSVGLHPWFLKPENMDAALAWLEKQAALPGVVAIGEAGLDKVCDTSWGLQEQAFRWCIDISERVKKPLVIHCVRAHNEVVRLKKELKPAQPWIFHGFNKNTDVAAMLLHEGCYLSFGASILRENNHSAEALQHTPAGHFFLETDDMQDIAIEQIYQKAAEIKGISVEELAETLEANMARCFAPHPLS